MVRQANAYPNKNERKIYLDAAARFRLPYWDIIMPRNEEQTTPPPGKDNPDPAAIWGCPEILKAEKVFVKLPKGDPNKSENGFWTIDNPLVLFKFPNPQEYGEHRERNKLELGKGCVAQSFILGSRLTYAQFQHIPHSPGSNPAE